MILKLGRGRSILVVGPTPGYPLFVDGVGARLVRGGGRHAGRGRFVGTAASATLSHQLGSQLRQLHPLVVAGSAAAVDENLVCLLDLVELVGLGRLDGIVVHFVGMALEHELAVSAADRDQVGVFGYSERLVRVRWHGRCHDRDDDVRSRAGCDAASESMCSRAHRHIHLVKESG